MRKPIMLLVAALMALSFGPNLAPALVGEDRVPGKVAMAAAEEPTPEAFPENLTGEVVAVEKGRRTMTVKQSGLFTSKEVTFAVAEPVAPMLAELQPGDRVRVGYVEAQMDGELLHFLEAFQERRSPSEPPDLSGLGARPQKWPPLLSA